MEEGIPPEYVDTLVVEGGVKIEVSNFYGEPLHIIGYN